MTKGGRRPITGQTTFVESLAISSNRGSNHPEQVFVNFLIGYSSFDHEDNDDSVNNHVCNRKTLQMICYLFRGSHIIKSPGVHSMCESKKVSAGALALAAPSSRARIRPTRSGERMIRTWWKSWSYKGQFAWTVKKGDLSNPMDGLPWGTGPCSRQAVP